MRKIRLYPSKIPNGGKKYEGEGSAKGRKTSLNPFRLVNITVVLFFSGAFLISFYGFRTMLPLMSLVEIIFAFVVLSYLIQITFFRTIFPMKKMEYLMVSGLGVAPCLTALFLIVNFYIHSAEKAITCRLSKVIHKNPYQYFEACSIPCERFPELCSVHADDLRLYKGMKVNITVSKGIFGFDVLSEVKAAE